MEIVYERVAAIDVGKKEVAVTVRVPGQISGTRAQQTRKFRTFYQVLRQMVGWLVDHGVTHVAMEATGVYWKPVFHALCEADTMEVVLVNARHVKNVPGRKTDVKDSEWLAQLLECGLLRGSFIPPKEIAAIRELTRYRKKTIQARTRELQRLSKVLEDAGIKIDSVASSITTLSARDMIEALIAGERDPRVLANLARGTMRTQDPGSDDGLRRAVRRPSRPAGPDAPGPHRPPHVHDRGVGRADRAGLAPFAEQLRLLRTIPGIGDRAAQVLISEIGVDMSRFPTAAHLASWAGLCPGNNESAGRRISGRTRKGNAEVRDILTECAWSAGKTGSYVGAQFHRLHRRFGKTGGGKAAVAVAHTLIVIIWHVLHDQSEYRELGHDYFTRRDNPEAAKRRLIHNLEALGYRVELTATA